MIKLYGQTDTLLTDNDDVVRTSTDGTYTIQYVVSDGTPTYSWVVQMEKKRLNK